MCGEVVFEPDDSGFPVVMHVDRRVIEVTRHDRWPEIVEINHGMVEEHAFNHYVDGALGGVHPADSAVRTDDRPVRDADGAVGGKPTAVQSDHADWVGTGDRVPCEVDDDRYVSVNRDGAPR